VFEDEFQVVPEEDLHDSKTTPEDFWVVLQVFEVLLADHLKVSESEF